MEMFQCGTRIGAALNCVQAMTEGRSDYEGQIDCTKSLSEYPRISRQPLPFPDAYLPDGFGLTAFGRVPRLAKENSDA
jgi:hypothetical protein